jgi:hypothetical protein
MQCLSGSVFRTCQAVPPRGRFHQTVGELGSVRPSLTEPVQLPGPTEPVSCKVGRSDRRKADGIVAVVRWR